MRRFKVVFCLFLTVIFSVSAFSFTLNVESGSVKNRIEFTASAGSAESVNRIFYRVESKPEWITEVYPDAYILTTDPDMNNREGYDEYIGKAFTVEYSENLDSEALFQFDLQSNIPPGTEGLLVFTVGDDTGREERIVIKVIVGEKSEVQCEEPLINDGNIVSYPNPAKIIDGKGEIAFENLKPGSVIRIYNIKGEEVKSIKVEMNMKRAVWYLRNNAGKLVASGIYIYTVESPDGKVFRDKIIVLK